MKSWIAILLAISCALNLVACTNTGSSETIAYHDQIFQKSALSEETIQWLEWYNGLTETKQLAISYIPSELHHPSGVSTEETRKKDIKTTFTGNLKTYYELSDGTWQCDDITYKYRLEITGTMPNTSATSTFVYLSNMETISFQQACLAAGISSNTADYFSPEEAVLVDWVTE